MRSSSYSGGRKSTVRSAHLEMELDHDTGEIDGRVLTGPMAGARLSSLEEEELLSLYRKIASDRDSGFKSMSKKEAYQILGVEPGASQQEILQAWQRIIKAVHPRPWWLCITDCQN